MGEFHCLDIWNDTEGNNKEDCENYKGDQFRELNKLYDNSTYSFIDVPFISKI